MKIRDLLIVLLIAGASCSNPVKKQLESLEETFEFEEKYLIDQTRDYFSNRALFNNFTSHLRFRDTLLSFYDKRDFKPVWAIYMSNDSLADLVLEVMGKSRFEGLRSEYYHLDSIRRIQRSLLKKGSDIYLRMAKLELLVSDNLLSYHRDRVKGRTHPDSVFGKTYQLAVREYEDFDLFEVLDNKNYREVIGKNGHKEPNYLSLSSLLKTYFDRIESGENWNIIDTTGVKKLEPGDTTNLMPQIAQKLFLMGVISEKEKAKADPFYYNTSFAPLVRRFQQGYGLYDDAIFGRNTFGLLNESLQDRVDQIAANLERIRWFELPKNQPYIAVNIPAYELQLWWNEKKTDLPEGSNFTLEETPDSVNNIRVCVGKSRPYNYDSRYAKYKKEQKYWLKPPDHETPQISSSVAYFVINPTWTVPNSIITREMFYQMKRDKNYLKDHGYGVFYKGKELKSDSIDWSKFSPTRVPFNIVQEAGLDNALGAIKFIFPNPFHIYLHDTPQKSKFKWSERAVSHGCVRVENPLLLGEFLMRYVNDHDADDLRIWMGHEPLGEERLEEYDPLDSLAKTRPIDSTKIVRLNKRMPVFFLYNTIWFEEDGKVQYRRDVYDKNKYIIQAMNF